MFERYGACHLLFNHAGVTTGGGGLPWEQEPNDGQWCFSVNVFGVANGVLAFVPRMLESGEPGVVVNTSSGDGGIAPVPYASVYTASKAAISCFTEALAHQLLDAGSQLRAAAFYPSGGLLDTGLWTAQRNRPQALARKKEHTPGPVLTFSEFRERLAAAGKRADVADLLDLGRFVVAETKNDSDVIGHDLDGARHFCTHVPMRPERVNSPRTTDFDPDRCRARSRHSPLERSNKPRRWNSRTTSPPTSRIIFAYSSAARSPSLRRHAPATAEKPGRCSSFAFGTSS